MSSLYSVWDIVRLPSSPCVLLSSCRVLISLCVTVRRPHPAEGQQLRRQRLCSALRRFLPMLGRHLVHHLAVLHGLRHHCWHRRVSPGSGPAETGLWELHPHEALKGTATSATGRASALHFTWRFGMASMIFLWETDDTHDLLGFGE